MKKLARVIGVVGGVAAVLWAMRDRLITIASPKEPEPPKFRVVPPGEDIDTGRLIEGDDLTDITGVGPVFAARLRAAGVTTFTDLATSDPESIADTAQVSESRAKDWIEQASARVS